MADGKFCSGCLRDGEQNTSEDWCCICAELVCKHCAKVHKRFDPPHKIVPVNEVGELSSLAFQMSKYCEIHEKQRIIKYCNQHETILCDQCVADSHTNCKGVVAIETAARFIRSENAVNDLQKKIRYLSEMSGDLLKKKMENLDLLKKQKEDILQSISYMRGQINAYLDEIEDDLKNDLSKRCQECVASVEAKKSEIENINMDLQVLAKSMIFFNISSTGTSLFKAIKNLELRIHKQENRINEFKKQHKLEGIRLQPHKAIAKLPAFLPHLGVLLATDKEFSQAISNVVATLQLRHMSSVQDLTKTTFTTKERCNSDGELSTTEKRKSGMKSNLLGKSQSGSLNASSRPPLNREIKEIVESPSKHVEKLKWNQKTSEIVKKKFTKYPSNDETTGEEKYKEKEALHDQCLPYPVTKRRKYILANTIDDKVLGTSIAFGKGCFIPGDKIVLPHYSDTFLYMCSVDGRNINTFKLDFKPWDVAMIDDNTCIVTMKKKGFQVLDMRTRRFSKCIKPGGYGCWALCCVKDKIWVERNDNSINQIDLNGTIVRKITTQHKLWDFCVAENGDIYYVTSLQSVVYLVKSDGSQKTFYSSSELREPSSITIDDQGIVYVSGRGSDNVHKISPEGTYYEIILKRLDGIYRPSALCFSKDYQKLMVINNSNKNVMIFNVQ